MKDIVLFALELSGLLFIILGLPFLSRWMPWIPGPRDLYDPTKDPARRLDYKPEPPKKKPVPMIIKVICVYAVLLVISIIVSLIAHRAK